MGIELYYSNRIETLAGKLADDLAAESAGNDPLAKPVVMVVNPNVQKWLTMEVARRNSIAANIDYPYLEKGLWQILEKCDPAEKKPLLLKSEKYQFLVLALILASRHNDPELAFLTNYLYDMTGARRADHSRRVWQLSEQLASVLREYEYNRKEMVEGWLEGKLLYEADAAASANLKRMEAAQKAVYLRLFGEGGIRDRLSEKTGEFFLTLPQYTHRLFAAGATKPKDGKFKDRSLHIFGTSQMSSFHMRLLFELGRHIDFKLYQLNVCREFWEDVKTPQEERWRRIRLREVQTNDAGEFLYIEEDDNKLLSRWGKPGRENIRLLGDLEEGSQGKLKFISDWKEAPEPPEKKTVLEMVQEHILNRTAPKDASGKIGQDTSIQIVGCPGMYREIEAVHNSIIANMLKYPDLKLTDIAVLVPNMASYKSVLESVFSRKPQHIPYNLTDSSAANDSVVAQAFIGMLELATGSFTRKDVFGLVFNAAFLAGIRRTREEALIWARWADELAIFHNFDKPDKAESGYADNDLYTWQHGLRRLRLGRVMETPDDGAATDEKSFASWHDIAPFSDIDSGDTDLVSGFCLVIEALVRRLAAISGKSFSCAEWSKMLATLIDDFLSQPDDRPEEERVIKGIRDHLRELSGNDTLFGDITKTGKLDLGSIREYMEERLGKINTGRGKYLAGGVTISTLLPMRPVPFKIAYIVGLSEGEFPGYPERSLLDLRHHRRKIGDVSKPEANRYLFLETLVSTRSKLYLTYVSRDLEKDKELHPCSVVNELKDYLNENILKEKEGFRTLKAGFEEEGWTDDIPLKGSSDKYLADDGRVKGWSDMLANFSQADRLACLLDAKERIPGAKKIEAALEKKRRELVPDYSAPSSETPMPEEERLTVRELRRFIENPIEASVRRHLGLYDEDEAGLITAESEPFYSVWPMDREFGSGILSYFVASCKGLKAKADHSRFVEEYFGRYYRYCRLRGRVPDQVFGELDKKKFEKQLKERLEGENGVLFFLRQRSESDFCANLIVGEAYYASAKGALVFPPLELDIKSPEKGASTVKVKLHGELPLVWKNRKEKFYDVLVITDRIKPSKRAVSKELLTPFLFYALLMALRASKKKEPPCEWIDDMPLRVHVAFKDEIDRPWIFRISPKEATAYLAELAGGLLAPGAFDVIPFEIITTYGELKKPDRMKKDAPKSEKDRYREVLEEAVDEELGKRFYSSYKPSDVVRLCDAKVPEDAYDKVHQRLGPLYLGIAADPEAGDDT